MNVHELTDKELKALAKAVQKELSERKEPNPAIKARFTNVLNEYFEGKIERLAELKRSEYKRYRSVGETVVQYAENVLKQHNLTFKQ